MKNSILPIYAAAIMLEIVISGLISIIPNIYSIINSKEAFAALIPFAGAIIAAIVYLSIEHKKSQEKLEIGRTYLRPILTEISDFAYNSINLTEIALDIYQNEKQIPEKLLNNPSANPKFIEILREYIPYFPPNEKELLKTVLLQYEISVLHIRTMVAYFRSEYMNFPTEFFLTKHNINTWGLEAVELNKTVGKIFLLLEEQSTFTMKITNYDDFTELTRQRNFARAMVAQHPDSFNLANKRKMSK